MGATRGFGIGLVGCGTALAAVAGGAGLFMAIGALEERHTGVSEDAIIVLAWSASCTVIGFAVIALGVGLIVWQRRRERAGGG